MDYSYYASAPPPQVFPPFFGHGLPDAQHPQPGATGADQHHQLNYQEAPPVVRCVGCSPLSPPSAAVVVLYMIYLGRSMTFELEADVVGIVLITM